jgi:hypothetical protein
MPESLDKILNEMSAELDGFITACIGRADGSCVAFLGGQKDSTIDDPQKKASITGGSEQNFARSLNLYNLVGASVAPLGMGKASSFLVTMQNGFLLLRFLEERHYYLSIFIDRKIGNVGNMILVSNNYAKRIADTLDQSNHLTGVQ